MSLAGQYSAITEQLSTSCPPGNMQSSAWLLVHVPERMMVKQTVDYNSSSKKVAWKGLFFFFTTVALRVSAKVLIWKMGTKANYSKCNNYFQTWDLKNQVQAGIQDFHTMVRIR